MSSDEPAETLRIRIGGPSDGPTLVYLPGIHGDWTLATPFRLRAARSVRCVEFTYPRNSAWGLDDYAENILAELERHNITHGWLLGESFGSQVAWAIHHRLQQDANPGSAAGVRTNPSVQTGPRRPFEVEGTIVAGGFAAYPAKTLARWLAAWRTRHPGGGLGPLFRLYVILLRLRFNRDAESREAAAEFIRRRRAPNDAEAILSRLKLLIAYDPAPVIARIRAPVFYLSGLFDPIVPWFLAARGLRRVSPSYAAGRVLPAGDHNVLGTAPEASALQILKWMNRCSAGHGNPRAKVATHAKAGAERETIERRSLC